MLPYTGSLSRKQRCCNCLRGRQGSSVIGDNRADHSWTAGIPVALDFRETAQGLNYGIVRALICVRSTFPKPADRDINDIRSNCPHSLLSHPDAFHGTGAKVMVTIPSLYRQLERGDLSCIATACGSIREEPSAVAGRL